MGEEPRSSVSSPSEKFEGLIGMDSAKLSLLVWLVFLAFGGGLLARYYSRIGYMPEITWEELLNYFAILSMVGGAVSLLYGLLLIAPGFIWSTLLIQDSKLKEVLCWGPLGRSERPCPLTICKRLVIPFLVFMLFAHLALWLDFWWQQHGLMLIVGVVLLSHFYCQVMIKLRCVKERLPAPEAGEASGVENPPSPEGDEQRVGEVEEQGIPEQCVEGYFGENPTPKMAGLLKVSRILRDFRKFHSDCRSLWLKYVLFFGLSFIIAWVSLWIVSWIAAPQNLSFPENAWLLAICTGSVTLASLFFVLIYPSSKGGACVMGLLMAFFLILAGEGLSVEAALSSRILASFGFGGEQRYTVVLTKDGRRLIEDAGLPDSVVVDDARLVDVCLLSRIGEDLIIDVAGNVVLLPKKYAVSWLNPLDANVGLRRPSGRTRHPACWN